MAREKKDYKVLSVRLEKEISNQLISCAEKRGQTITTCLERILKEYFTEHPLEKE